MFTVKLPIFVVASCLFVIVSVRRPSRHSPFRLLALRPRRPRTNWQRG